MGGTRVARVVHQRAGAPVGFAVAARERHARHGAALVEVLGGADGVAVAGARVAGGLGGGGCGAFPVCGVDGVVRQARHGDPHGGGVGACRDFNLQCGLRRGEVGAPPGVRLGVAGAAFGVALGHGLELGRADLRCRAAGAVAAQHGPRGQGLHPHAQAHAVGTGRDEAQRSDLRALRRGVPLQQRGGGAGAGGRGDVARLANFQRLAALQRGRRTLGCGEGGKRDGARALGHGLDTGVFGGGCRLAGAGVVGLDPIDGARRRGGGRGAVGGAAAAGGEDQRQASAAKNAGGSGGAHGECLSCKVECVAIVWKAGGAAQVLNGRLCPGRIGAWQGLGCIFAREAVHAEKRV